jgi:Chaperone for flagella basal body P-ring formation
MSKCLCLWLLECIPLILHGVFTAISAQAACYSTPRNAIDALEANSSVVAVSESGGYRVTRIQSDPLLGQRWAIITSCTHPEWPAWALQANETNSSNALREGARPLIERVRQVPLIRAGDIVSLWRQENLLRIEVTGVSEESASLGKTIHVRLLHNNTDNQSTPAQLSGIVRGPSNVEMLR